MFRKKRNCLRCGRENITKYKVTLIRKLKSYNDYTQELKHKTSLTSIVYICKDCGAVILNSNKKYYKITDYKEIISKAFSNNKDYEIEINFREIK